MIEYNAYIVVEIPEPVRSQVQALRDSLNTPTARLPVEITIAGSSGLGPIPAGTDLSLIQEALDRLLPGIPPFLTQFTAIRSFPNSSVYYLEPFDRSPFDALHQKMRLSDIPFVENPWPYNPHCTLRTGNSFSDEAAVELLARPFPGEEFLIDTVSVCQLDHLSMDCTLLYQRPLGVSPNER